MIDHDYISFDKPLAILINLKAPLYNVIGNHDFEVEDKFKGQVRKRLGNKKGYFDFEDMKKMEIFII
jgi:manganese-dependent ADP-ribose/CDP-alcohol diphosphatase